MATKEILEEMYYRDELSIRQIAKTIGKTYATTQLLLKKHDIKPFKSGGNRQIKGSKFDILNDKEWLYQKYEAEKLSTLKISKRLGCNTNTIRQSLIRNGFKIRNMREAQIIKSNGSKLIIDMEIINGIMLGDAHMHRGKTEKSMPFISHTSKHIEYSNHISKILFGDLSRIYEGKKAFRVRSLSDDRLKNIYNKWYKNKVKTVPNDLVITPKTLLYWFMDDGSSYQRRKQSKIKQVYVILCTESFSKGKNLFLIEQLKKLGINPKLRNVKWGSGYRIIINQSEYKEFLNIIGSSPVECFRYKWK